jgi:hypothetical protein
MSTRVWGWTLPAPGSDAAISAGPGAESPSPAQTTGASTRTTSTHPSGLVAQAVPHKECASRISPGLVEPVLPEPAFLKEVSLDFGVANITQHDHVPLPVSPWS